MCPSANEQKKRLRARGRRAMAKRSGVSPTHASGHKSKSGKAKTRRAAERVANPVSASVGTAALARCASALKRRSSLAVASRDTAFCTGGV